MGRSSKGSEFERGVCRQLSEWWSNGKDDDLFWRTSQSGGRATTRSRKGKQGARGHCGDITATDKVGAPLVELITFELKRGYHHCHLDLVLDKPSRAKPLTFETWLGQAIAAAERAKSTYWAIIHRRDRREACIYFPEPLYSGLKAMGCFHWSRTSFIKYMEPDGFGVVGLTLETFLNEVDPQDIRILHRRLT